MSNASFLGLDRVLDVYSLRARSYPAAFTLFPIVLAAAVLLPDLSTWWATLGSLAAAGGVGLALAEFAQSRGTARQPYLLQVWGGAMQSTLLLRWTDARIDPITKGRWHAFLKANVPNPAFPAEVDERAGPRVADQHYNSACAWLRERTRADRKKFDLIFQQNVRYGFRRNLFGLRPYGLAIAAIAIAIVAFAVRKSSIDFTQMPDAKLLIALVIALAWILWFAFVVTVGWVTGTAEEYGRALLGACDALAVPPRPTAARRQVAPVP